MRRWLIGLGVVLLLAVAAWAQTAPVIQWQHDGVNVTYFNCVVDGPAPAGTTTSLGIPSKVDEYYSIALSSCTGVMVNGTHSVVIQACNTGGCTSATAITVVKL